MATGFLPLDAALNVGKGIFDGLSSFQANVYNDAKTIQDREDTAYQRMVADMKAAGLNPWTGISSGGLSASSVNPSMDSLSATMSVLGGLLNVEGASLKSFKTRVLDVLDLCLDAFTGLVRGASAGADIAQALGS